MNDGINVFGVQFPVFSKNSGYFYYQNLNAAS
jgi:hypothetical protein